MNTQHPPSGRLKRPLFSLTEIPKKSVLAMQQGAADPITFHIRINEECAMNETPFFVEELAAKINMFTQLLLRRIGLSGAEIKRSRSSLTELHQRMGWPTVGHYERRIK